MILGLAEILEEHLIFMEPAKAHRAFLSLSTDPADNGLIGSKVVGAANGFFIFIQAVGENDLVYTVVIGRIVKANLAQVKIACAQAGENDQEGNQADDDKFRGYLYEGHIVNILI